MEINVTATFKTQDDLQQAADALKTQEGIIDMQFETNALEGMGLSDGSEDAVQPFMGEAYPAYQLSVYVERSMYRLAQDTMIRYGGQL